MAKLLFNHPSDNIIGNATLSLPTGTADAAYPLANIRDGDPALPFKATGTSIRIVFDFGSAVSLGLVALIHQNFTGSPNLRWQGHTADSWGTPDIDLAIATPSTDEDGYINNPFVDVTGQAAKRYWSLVNNSANGANVIIGEIWIGSTSRTPAHNHNWGFSDTEHRRIDVQRTAADVEFRYDRGSRRRRLSSEIHTSDAGFSTLRSWCRACRGRARNTLLIPDPDVNSALFVRWENGEADFDRRGEFLDHNVLPVSWIEISPGLPWIEAS